MYTYKGISDNAAPLKVIGRTHKLVVDDGWRPLIRQKRARVYLDDLWKISGSHEVDVLTSVPKGPSPAYTYHQAVIMRRAVRDPSIDSGAAGFLHFRTINSSQCPSFRRYPVIVPEYSMPREVHVD